MNRSNMEDYEYCLTYIFGYYLPMLISGIYVLIILTSLLGYIIHYIQDENWKNLFSKEFAEIISLPSITWILLVLTMFCLFMCWQKLPRLNSTVLIILGIPIFVIIHIIIRVNLLDLNPLYAIKQVQQLGVGYGSCMADSYLNGYLNIVLPHDGKESKGILERIRNYKDQEKVEVPMENKLFILIPSSGFLPPDLETTSEGWIEVRKPLEVLTLSRGGVTNRIYKNSVYSIQRPGEWPRQPVFIVMEGATPILTLLEGSKGDSERLRNHKNKIIKDFYKSLKLLLESDPKFNNLYELVYYDDENGRRNVGKMILDTYFKNNTK